MVLTTFENGAIAQLGERLTGSQEVGGSIPPGSIKFLLSKNNSIVITLQMKRDYEKWVALKTIEILKFHDFEFERMGNDVDEPDAIINSKGHKIGIEIAAVYLDEESARFEWDYSRGKRKDFGAPSPLQINPKEKFSEFLQGVLNKKCKKNYVDSEFEQVWLVIEERNPLSNSGALKTSLKSILVPKNKFEKILILHLSPLHEGGEYKIITIK